MENKGYLIYEVGILGGNDKVKTNLFVLFVLYDKFLSSIDKIVLPTRKNDTIKRKVGIRWLHLKK